MDCLESLEEQNLGDNLVWGFLCIKTLKILKKTNLVDRDQSARLEEYNRDLHHVRHFRDIPSCGMNLFQLNYYLLFIYKSTFLPPFLILEVDRHQILKIAFDLDFRGEFEEKGEIRCLWTKHEFSTVGIMKTY